MLDGFKGCLARVTADLNIGFRNGRNDEAIRAGPRRLGYFLDKGDEVVKCR